MENCLTNNPQVCRPAFNTESNAVISDMPYPVTHFVASLRGVVSMIDDEHGVGEEMIK